MSECEQAIRLNAYHDGELSPAARADLERHLGQCPQCSAELERLRRLRGMFASLPRPELPAFSRQRLHRAVERLPAAGIMEANSA